MMNRYLFESERLGFRNWSHEDQIVFRALNADKNVMEFFPSVLTSNDSDTLLVRLQSLYKKYGYTYYATELKETKELIGFVGIAYQDYLSQFTPAVDIGWRLLPYYWGKGYATEGAKKCLDYAFNVLSLPKIISICPVIHVQSYKVMEKIGMSKVGEFIHPKLKEFPNIKRCFCYEINSKNKEL